MATRSNKPCLAGYFPLSPTAVPWSKGDYWKTVTFASKTNSTQLSMLYRRWIPFQFKILYLSIILSCLIWRGLFWVVFQLQKQIQRCSDEAWFHSLFNIICDTLAAMSLIYDEHIDHSRYLGAMLAARSSICSILLHMTFKICALLIAIRYEISAVSVHSCGKNNNVEAVRQKTLLTMIARGFVPK